MTEKESSNCRKDRQELNRYDTSDKFEFVSVDPERSSNIQLVTRRTRVASIEPLKRLEDDALPTLEIGTWGEEKYRHVQLYASLFIKSMRSKWDALVYLTCLLVRDDPVFAEQGG